MSAIQEEKLPDAEVLIKNGAVNTVVRCDQLTGWVINHRFTVLMSEAANCLVHTTFRNIYGIVYDL
jgi:hypothetical protein